ncbi:MAG: alkaline phosphatase family protein [Deltaproteobacteria bacterium]|nr:alkaline phosphatase family protein [Deltaproteobacteria bacterium]
MAERFTRREMMQAGLALGAAAVLPGAGCGSEGGGDEVRPPGPLGQIDTFVILMMENRSFDHYLGSLKLLEGRALDGLGGAEVNLAPDGSPVPSFKLDDFTPEDPPHGWSASHAQWNNGANDGFVKAHAGPSQNDVMGYHVRQQLPTLYQLADGYTVCDRWFASVMGPTWPNRFHLHAGTSEGMQSNNPVLGLRSIFDQLEEAGISAANYYHDVAFAAGGYRFTRGLRKIERFFSDAAAGTLPRFSIIDPAFAGDGANDDHPDHDIRLGQALIASIHAALAASPQWERMLFVLTYDEHGGFYDHVSPPTIAESHPGFEQLGFRVPTVVAGGRVKRGAVVSAQYEHSSVLATVTRRFGLEPLNPRVAAAADLSECLDPALVMPGTRVQPATLLTPVEVPLSALRGRFRARRRPGDEPHGELLEAAARVMTGEHDRRGQSAEVVRRVLQAGARLGAVSVR